MQSSELKPEDIRVIRDRIALFVRVHDLMSSSAYRGFSWRERWRLYKLYFKAARNLPSQTYLAQIVHASRVLDIALKVAQENEGGAQDDKD